jgi:hypothetical protein
METFSLHIFTAFAYASIIEKKSLISKQKSKIFFRRTKTFCVKSIAILLKFTHDYLQFTIKFPGI